MTIALLAFALGVAQAGSTAPPVSTTPTLPAKEKMVCRHEDETGTRMGRHTRCQTASEWQREEAEAETAISNLQKQDIIRKPPAASLTAQPLPQ